MPIVADPAAYVPENILKIDVDQIKWSPIGYTIGADSRGLLKAVVRIGGADHHLKAIEITKIGDVQCGINGTENEVQDLDLFDGGGGGPFETVTIEGREYVLVMTPFRT